MAKALILFLNVDSKKQTRPLPLRSAVGIACRSLSLFLPICFTKNEQKRVKQHLKSKFAGQREPGRLWEQPSLPTRLLGSTLETERNRLSSGAGENPL